MSIPAGTIADRWGVVTTLVGGQLVIALGLLAVSAAPSYAVLMPLMMLAGYGYGMLTPTSTKAVMAWSGSSRPPAPDRPHDVDQGVDVRFRGPVVQDAGAQRGAPTDLGARQDTSPS